MINANELSRRAMIIIDGEPYQVTEIIIALPSARGASTLVRTKVRHLVTGAVHEKVFRASDKVPEADVETVVADYLYKNSDSYCFMSQKTFEMIELSASVIGSKGDFLSEELTVKIIKFNDEPVALELPQLVHLKVAETEYGSQQSGSAGSGTKNATLETGLVVRVPQHISAGETVRVNTETGEVTGRA
ncbi:MAG: elongation factor P [Candidatus Omnitrophica bacterium]|nr:elongation factor P [Candidatus Omnitrophota bacterium]